MRLSHELFAAQGNEWNTPNWQHNASPIVRQIERLDGRLETELGWEIEGYGPDGEPCRAPERREYRDPAPKPSEGRIKLLVEMRTENGPVHRPAEYRRIVREGDTNGRHPDAVDVVLTPDMLERRKRQRAAVKARMTKAANKLKAQEQARLAMVQALRVKLSQK